jgi:hypothetical protein
MRHIVKKEKVGDDLEEMLEDLRPKIRGDCQNGPRPCPWVGCRYHLYLEVMDSGSIRYRFPNLELWELKETCALDVADRGGMILDKVGAYLNVTRERVRQTECFALFKLFWFLKELEKGSDD